MLLCVPWWGAMLRVMDHFGAVDGWLCSERELNI